MHASTHRAQPGIKRFDFFSLRDFAAPAEEARPAFVPAAEETPPPPPPPPTFSERDLEAAKTHAYEEGRMAGVQEGAARAAREHAEQEAALVHAVRLCCEHLARMRQEHAAHLAGQQEALTQLALAAARQAAGAALRALPDACIADMVRECLPMISAEPRIGITVHPSIILLMKERLEEVGRQVGYEGTLVLEADANFSPGDCRVQWEGGEASMSQQEIWNAIVEKLAQRAGHAVQSHP
jgi:flagellar assembly protein FliH